MNNILKGSFFLLILVTLLTACKKDTVTADEGYYGRWNVMLHSQGLIGVEQYDKGDVVWIFNKNNTVDIKINTTLKDSYMPFTSTQTVKYDVDEANSKITFKKVDNGSKTLDFLLGPDEVELRVSNKPELDGPGTFLERD